MRVGFILGVVALIILGDLPFSDGSKYRQAIHECEKNLPRNQHCEVIGVVIELPAGK